VFSAIGVEPDSKGSGIRDEMTKAAQDSISNIEDLVIRDTALRRSRAASA
jgi:hypothetical protein